MKQLLEHYLGYEFNLKEVSVLEYNIYGGVTCEVKLNHSFTYNKPCYMKVNIWDVLSFKYKVSNIC